MVNLGSAWITRLPFSYDLTYLIVGIFFGSNVTGLISLRPDTQVLDRITEMVVIVSVFGYGLKINRKFQLKGWNTTARLIGLVMPIRS